MAADLLDPPPDPYASDPVAFAREVLGFEPWSKQVAVMESVRDHERTAVRSCHGVGKSLPLDTPLPTPTGWTTMGTVQVGDLLLNESGQPTVVTYVSPIWTTPCSKVTFDDGTELVASDDHRWTALRYKPRAALRGRAYVGDWRDHWSIGQVATTAEIAGSLKNNGQTNWSVPTCRPLDLPHAALPIDPYVFGAWLGDGCSSGAHLYAHASDVPFICDQLAAAGEQHRVTVERTCSKVVFGRRERLTALGVVGKKHIPALYLRASSEQRLAMLQGVLDTDGSARGDGTASIDLCNERLARDVAELIRSFGWKLNLRTAPATIDGRTVGTRWRMHFRPDLAVFRMPRKACRCVHSKAQRCRQTHRLIADVQSVPTVPTRCITVQSPSHLFLAGEAMVPTHNTATAAQVALWFLHTHRDSRVITTAPTWAQVEQLMWREIRAAVGRAHQAGLGQMFPTPTASKLELGDQWFAIGLSTNEPERFQGHHADHILLIVDEASGVQEDIFAAAEGFLTAEGAKVLMIGNPTRVGTTFHRAFTQDADRWSRIHISGRDAPNATGEPVPSDVARSMPRADWVQESADKWGADSPFFQVRVLGEFPSNADDCVIPLHAVQAAQDRTTIVPYHATLTDVTIGVDVARFGSDETVITTRHGNQIRIRESYAGKPLTETFSRVMHWWSVLRDESGADPRIVVDDDGLGGGLTDMLRHSGEMQVTAFNGGGRARRPDKYPNRRSELWFSANAWLPDLDLDADDQLAADLTSPRYRIDDRTRRVVERKDDTKKRLKRSPDRADSVLLTLVMPVPVSLPDRTHAPMRVQPGMPGWDAGAPSGGSLTGDLLDMDM